jgi:hypothetical protein
MLIGLHRKRFEAALIQMAAANVLVMGMLPLRKGQGQPMHDIGQFAILLRPKHEVPMVGHQAIGQQAHAGHVLLRLGHDIEERRVVHFFVKDREPTISSIEDMIKLASQRHAQRSSHRLQVITKGSAWQEKKGPDTFSPRFVYRSII